MSTKENRESRPGPTPAFMRQLVDGVKHRGRRIFSLTGDVMDLFPDRDGPGYSTLEERICQSFSSRFTMVRLDLSLGVGFYESQQRHALFEAIGWSRRALPGAGKPSVESLGGLLDFGSEIVSKHLRGNSSAPAAQPVAPSPDQLLERTKQRPGAALVLLRELTEMAREASDRGENIKPVCTIVRLAGAFFPPGDFGKLSELDRNRLATLLSWLSDPAYQAGGHITILIADNRSELNSRIHSLPSSQSIEVGFPNDATRRHFVARKIATFSDREDSSAPTFETSEEDFVEDAAGLGLNAISSLLEESARSGKAVTRAAVNALLNEILKSQLDGVVTIKRPSHGDADLCGYKGPREAIKRVFRDCEDPETAISAFVVSGPNGVGKTFNVEAHAADSGRIVIELSQIRSSDFGGTDRLFEMVRRYVEIYGKVAILVDEAHAAFGSIHSGETHDTEKRLMANIIKMMSDKGLLSKVVWCLMTTRPDLLDPDVLSRAPKQIPIFDLEGGERSEFFRAMFAHRDIELGDAELADVVAATGWYSNRDLDFLIREVKSARRDKPDTLVTEVLETWSASKGIVSKRAAQSLIAASTSSYPALVPARFKTPTFEDDLQRAKVMLSR
ncbi:AAA family ATPase [Haloferula rosea]|uniref:AAA family ATPase n=1 Tax=Haloferula rosea TaxID=490093 RepID=A0A934RCR8_9BACT|nr:AAA family ATPase [Haloferula rosea]MBK1827338.1 AAA family ATPase [Haloferula rosea]